ncbi:hypothetical protein [Streptomyces sp. bgisy100]|uniref:hypothetical protein n=1 Tax=Streptomyces sp. bgisy100 TaxID=3413783 RepID=UPI003D750AEC
MTDPTQGAADDPVAELVRRLIAGESPEAIRRSALPAEWGPVLRAAAAAAVFDSTVYDQLLRPACDGPAAPGLPDLVAERLVVPLPGGEGRYQLADEDRSHYLARWFDGTDGTPPPELRSLADRLATHWRAAGDRTEELRHLLLADPAAAAELFGALFEEADHDRDFARCQDLVDVLTDPDRSPYTDSGTAALALDRSGYLRAQAYWAADYARSALYREPAGLREQAMELLGEDGPRVLQLYATGGAGKTMALRWLVSRVCVPAPRDVACARLDLDVLDPVNAARHPWLLLLEIADQLQRRLPQRSFERLDEFAPYRRLLRRQSTDATASAAHALRSSGARSLSATVTRQFVNRLNRLEHPGPVLVVVDTMEEAALRSDGGADRLLRFLGEIVRACPRLRLVLSGRFDPRRRCAEANRALGPAAHHELKRFSPETADGYLRDIRGVTDPRLRAVAVARSRGLPFTLALFADTIEQEPGITPEELAGNHEPLVRYLVDRVVQRIEDPAVRWLLRYGVVPRRLRFEHLTDVMCRPLARGMSVPGDGDDPRKDRHHLRGRDDVFPFDHGAGSRDEARPFAPPQLEADELKRAWRRLLGYAGQASWISDVSGDEHTVVFHSDVRAPMRRLIADKPVFRELHLAFARRFEERAESNPEEWSSNLADALYHRFQTGDPEAVDRWRGAVHRALDDGAFERVRELAGEVLGEEYVDDDGRPRPGPHGRPLVGPDVLREAHQHLAYAAFRTALRDEVDSSDPLWSETQRHTSRADAYRRPGGPDARDPRRTAVQAALLRIHGQHREAAEAVWQALRDHPDPVRTLDLWRVLSDCHADDRNPGAAAAILEALGRRAGDLGDLDMAEQAALALARHHSRAGRLDQALDWCRRAVDVHRSAARNADGRAALEEAFVLLSRHEPAAALSRLTEARWADPAHRSTAARLRARSAWLLGRAVAALSALDEAERHARGIDGTARYRHLAETEQLRGAVLGELRSVERAESCFHRATRLWAELGYVDGHPECRYLHARFLADEVGDLRTAARVASPAPQPAPDGGDQPSDGNGPAPDDTAAVYDLKAALLLRALRRMAPDLELPGGPRPPADTGSPVCVPQAAVAEDRASPRLLALRLLLEHPEPTPEAAAALESAVAALSPPQARVALLAELRDDLWADGSGGGSAWWELLRPLLAPAPATATTRQDTDAQRLVLAGYDATGPLAGDRSPVAGATARLEVALQQACRELGEDRLLTVWRGTQALLRSGATAQAVRLLPQLHAAGGDFPHLRGVCLLYLAEAPGQIPGQAADLIEKAAELTGAVQRPTAWAARLRLHRAEQARDDAAAEHARRMLRELGWPAPGRDVPPVSGLLSRRPGEHIVPVVWPDGLDQQRMLSSDDLLAADWQDVEPLMRRVLAARGGAGPDRDAGALRLDCDDPIVHALPWELALWSDPPDGWPGGRPLPVYRSLPRAASGLEARWLRSAVVDVVGEGAPADTRPGSGAQSDALTKLRRGMSDDAVAALATVATASAAAAAAVAAAALPATAGAAGIIALITAFRMRRRRQLSPGVPQVATLRKELPALPRGVRHSHDVVGAYERAGWRVLDVEAAGPLVLAAAPGSRAAVIHVHAPLRIHQGTPCFDLSSYAEDWPARRGTTGTDLYPFQLAGWFEAFPSGTEPLVVLDPPRPASDIDVGRQLVLRNLFAALLFAHGSVPTVVGAGLDRAGSLRTTRILAGCLADGQSLAELSHRLHGGTLPDRPVGNRFWRAGESLATAATAIFATPSAFEAP